MFYISTDTVEKAYQQLTSVELKDPNIAHYFLIIKACGINKLTYEVPSFVDKNGLYYASRISSLFTPQEEQPKKFGFINPFAMREWAAQPISETLSKWITSRLKNNILGGGMQWRSILEMDTSTDEKKIKFKYDYIKIIKNLAFDSDTINIIALAIWSNRFTCFEKKVTIKELVDEFKRTYKLTVDEVNEFFNSQQEYDLEFSEEIYDAKFIRNLIGEAPSNAWAATNLGNDKRDEYVVEAYDFQEKPAEVQEVTPELICNLLESYHQLILSGPPGTSKSYFATKVSENYDKVIHVQFHPQYSYQNFVGGYVVDGTEVKFKNGVILDLLTDDTFDEQKKYLIIIDEFNRANVSQVLGEAIQLLDRTASVDINIDGTLQNFSLPKNIHILATLNTTDRTLGTIDYAIKRRFLSVYCPANPGLLIDLCPSSGFISLCDFLTKLNNKLVKVTGNRDLTVGHAIFLNDSIKQGDKFVWDIETFRVLYNYKILPMIEDYCSNNQEMIEDIVGNKLSSQLDSTAFKDAIADFMEI